MEFRNLKKQYEVLQEQIDSAVSKVCKSAHFIGGPEVRQLENTLAEYAGVKNCITCGNGTDALSLALMAWNIGPGDAVFVPDFTFFASGECAAALGAVPVFADVQKDTFNLDPKALEEAVIRVLDEGIYTPKAVIAVDLFGLPADYPAIRAVCDQYHLYLLEDGAQGFGGEINSRRACSFGDISTTSFFPAKPLGCYGDGGAVFTDHDEWAELIRSLAAHGRGTDKFENVRLGMNSRLDTIQAAVLQVKLKALQDYELADINRAAGIYDSLFAGTEAVAPKIPRGWFSSRAQYTIQLPISADRSVLQARLKTEGIPTGVYYPRPMHEQPAFKGTYSAKAGCPVTEQLCRTVLSLPLDPYMQEADCRRVAEQLLNLL